jgi:hypothetical protein
VGDVDYRLLTSFVRAKRENADERAGKRDVEELLSLLERRVQSYRSIEPVGQRPKGTRSGPVQPHREL